MLRIENLNVQYQSGNFAVHAVKNFCLEVGPRSSVGLVGESGSGKSTIALAILGLLGKQAKISGKIYLEGQDLLQISCQEMRALRWQKIAMVFQKSMSSFSPVHTVGEHMIDVYKIHKKKGSIREASRRALECLEMVRLPAKVLHLYPHELSGGMAQRVGIALSLLHSPKLLILDEATTALDVIVQHQILEEIRQIQDACKLVPLVISHDLAVIASLCRYAVVLWQGETVEAAPVQNIFKNPSHPYTQKLIQAYQSV